MLLLSIWSWEHLPVGRPTPKGYDPWDDHDDPDRMPTWAYKWDKVEGFVGNSKTMYLHYCNELDIMTPEQVIFSSFLLCLFGFFGFPKIILTM